MYPRSILGRFKVYSGSILGLSWVMGCAPGLGLMDHDTPHRVKGGRRGATVLRVCAKAPITGLSPDPHKGVGQMLRAKRHTMAAVDLDVELHSTRWRSRGSFVRICERYVTKFAQHRARRSISWCKLPFDGRVALHCVDVSSHNYEIISLNGFRKSTLRQNRQRKILISKSEQ